MRALRIFLIIVVILGGLFVAADRLAVHFAEGEVADRLKTQEGLAETPSVDIKGFPFLTQVAGGKLNDVQVGMDGYEADTTVGGTVRIEDLEATMKDVSFSGDYSSATAATATGGAVIPYGELLKAAKSQPVTLAPGITAQVTGISAGGGGKIKVSIKISVGGASQTYPVLASVTVVDGDTVVVKADSLPSLGISLADSVLRSVTDFQQKIEGLPGGIKLNTVQGGTNGVEITVKGSNVKLAG
ncbi:DUF2993 domain-containing protein [Streptomyces sp. NPDC047072]|uniref:LmeA family phospholipid-binding protein n=1 Tax=Streptomyces sp. NPDC047072 TaxID=3154809 RepID=UPI0033C346A7